MNQHMIRFNSNIEFMHRDEDEGRDKGYKVSESSSYYIFHKTLSSTSYTLSKVN